ncbi:MAG TPA: hypothetical protein VGL55_03680 [Steroidobacteraceae bacterium]|jgi:hypothetical protein
MNPTDHIDEDQEEYEFTITSSDAYVAAALIPCGTCHAKTEVICIHCETGTVSGEALSRFTISDVTAIDKALARQLEPWPTFRKVGGSDVPEGDYANHCRHCGAVLDDMYLHSEPDEPFFDVPGAPPGSIKLAPLEGTIRLSGDEHFDLD